MVTDRSKFIEEKRKLLQSLRELQEQIHKALVYPEDKTRDLSLMGKVDTKFNELRRQVLFWGDVAALREARVETNYVRQQQNKCWDQIDLLEAKLAQIRAVVDRQPDWSWPFEVVIDDLNEVLGDVGNEQKADSMNLRPRGGW